ncbi:MAG: hypothetical protein ACLTBV_26035 [Enterocloster bolteae]
MPYERYVLWISLPTLQQLASIDEDLNYFLTAKGMKNYLLRRHTTAWGNFRTIFTSLEEALGEQKPLRHAQVKAFILHLLVEYNLALMEDSGTAQSGVRDNPADRYPALYTEPSHGGFVHGHHFRCLHHG